MRTANLQISLRTLLALIACIVTALAVLRWTGFLARDGVWEVTAIVELDVGTWHGETDSGEPIAGAILEYQAECVDGDRMLRLTLETHLGNPLDIASLPLQKGDMFRILDATSRPSGQGIVTLPDGTMIQKLTSRSGLPN